MKTLFLTIWHSVKLRKIEKLEKAIQANTRKRLACKDKGKKLGQQYDKAVLSAQHYVKNHIKGTV